MQMKECTIWMDGWINHGKICGMGFVASSQHARMACFVNQVMSVAHVKNTSQLHQ